MPALHIHDQQYPIAPGTTRLGAPEAAEIPVAAGTGVQAIVEMQAGAGVTIRRATGDAVVRVNGVALGAEPTPLLHGDRIEISGVDIRYADEQQAGATQFVSGGEIAAMAARRGATMATTGSGGRLVSLVDGKEYAVPVTGLVIGREVGADVVVPLAEVSRRHAEIVPTGEGYRLTDLSTNGVLVNGERVVQSRLLNRSDVIRIGSEEFRFYADVARPTPAPPAAVAPEAAPAAPPRAAAASPPVTAAAGPSGRAPLKEPPTAAPAPAPGAPKPSRPPRPAPAAPPTPAPASGGSLRFWVWLLLVVIIIATALFVMG
ncbi:MAG TPA: FHA domain-containing protein [Gemmatimonadaceae bacterium]|nr:FHA domain-containing protein [Gemmatimonadaceae bacterium]